MADENKNKTNNNSDDYFAIGGKVLDSNGNTIIDRRGRNFNQKFTVDKYGVTLNIDASKLKGVNDGKIAAAVEYYLTYGNTNGFKLDTKEQNAFNEVLANAAKGAGITLSDLQNRVANADSVGRIDPQQAAFNEYWNEMYSRNEGTLGAEAYENMLLAEQNAARDAMTLADAQAQQLALAQAQTVKDITDSLRAERMSRLRAGMSESQIASQDMQTMMANTNALNDQIMASNLGVLQGQQQYDNARTTAYNNWLNAMNQTATNGAAMAASDAGSLDMQARKIASQLGISMQQAYKYAQGGFTTNTDGKQQ